MPRPRNKSVKDEVNHTYRYCIYCKANRDNRGFDKHQAACRVIWQLQRRQEDSARHRSAVAEQGNKQRQAGDGINIPTSEVMSNLPTYVYKLTF